MVCRKISSARKDSLWITNCSKEDNNFFKERQNHITEFLIQKSRDNDCNKFAESFKELLVLLQPTVHKKLSYMAHLYQIIRY